MSFSIPLRERYYEIDSMIVRGMARWGVPLLRVSVGVVFLWFGVLKFCPGLSSAEGLALKTTEALTFGLVPPGVALLVLATWETAIGIGLLVGRYLRAVLALLFLQMVGTFSPLLLFPFETFVVPPFVPTLEGQYILKNFVLVSAGLVIGATVRGGRLVENAAPRGG